MGEDTLRGNDEKIKNNNKWQNVVYLLEIKKYYKKSYLEILGTKISQKEYDKHVETCVSELCDNCNFKLNHTVLDQLL